MCGPGPVVGDHGVQGHASGSAVDQDDRETGVDLRHQVALVVGGRHQDQAVDPPFDKAVDQVALALGLLVWLVFWASFTLQGFVVLRLGGISFAELTAASGKAPTNDRR